MMEGAMPIAEWIAVEQTPGPETHGSNTPDSGLFVIALLAVVVGFVVLMSIRASAKGAKR
jgi:hypothetical protein